MKLYLLRHGEAANPVGEPSLSDKGRLHIERLATFLNLKVPQIYHSGKLRASQTAEIIANKMSPSPQINILKGLNPEDNPSSLLETIQHWQQITLLVGHLPFMTKLAALLLTGYEDGCFLNITPGTILCLEKDTTQHWVLQWMITADVLH